MGQILAISYDSINLPFKWVGQLFSKGQEEVHVKRKLNVDVFIFLILSLWIKKVLVMNPNQDTLFRGAMAIYGPLLPHFWQVLFL